MKMNQNTTKPSFLKWFLMILFPPYGVYVFLFKTKFRWFVKAPVGIIALIFLILSIDTALNPYRVEDDQSEKVITAYLNQHDDDHMGKFRTIERKGAFAWKEKTYIVYRTLTTNGTFDFIIAGKENGKYKVDGIFQTYPVQVWKQKDDETQFPTAPMAMLFIYEHQEQLGNLKKVYTKDNQLFFKTSKGTFQYIFMKNKITEITKETGEIVLQEKDQYTLPEKVVDYFDKNKKELGKINEVFEYGMDTEKESYHIRTPKGHYRVDVYDNGDIKLLKANE